MNQWKRIVFLGLSLIFLPGCGPSKPEGIPDLYPVKVTVKNGETPVTGAKVTLTTANAQGSWSTFGETDALGDAVIQTLQGSWVNNGVPAGDYIVYIIKMPDFESTPMPDGLDNDPKAKEAFIAAEKKKLDTLVSEIPKSLSNAGTTPLKLTVTSDATAELTVDIAEYKK
ncbi:MAG: hypothetical protein LBQ54_16255 [Planctomycetaceae bacterium]|jgi:hypothetical protein|nr:hypothetical protein [Planctomycetaceae bacterium]